MSAKMKFGRKKQSKYERVLVSSTDRLVAFRAELAFLKNVSSCCNVYNL